MRYIFHLSIPVSDLRETVAFYRDAFGATIGRSTHDWVDILLWGHQITLQLRPNEVLPSEPQGKRHFGVVLPWGEWKRTANQLEQAQIHFLVAPEVLYESTPEEQAKFYVQDPSINVIEVKVYRDFQSVLGTKIEDYSYRSA